MRQTPVLRQPLLHVVDFNANGTYNVWQIDQDKNLKEVTPD